MDKKRKLFVRVLCLILALIMTLGVVVQVAFASEIENASPYQIKEGFEYVEQNGDWVVTPTGDKPVLQLTNVPDSFTRDNVPVLLANLSTYKVQVINLLEMYGYADVLDIEDGYYLLYTNSYCFEDENGEGWLLNGANTYYFYTGDMNNYDANKYDLSYITSDGVLGLPLEKDTKNTLPRVKSSRIFHLDDEDTIYPLDELHNWDELQDRMEHIDLEATLEEGHPVYMDGYEPNSIDHSNDPQTSGDSSNAGTSGESAANDGTNTNLGELASQGNQGSNIASNGSGEEVDMPLPEEDVPIANPSIITTTPADKPAENSSTETTPATEGGTLNDAIEDAVYGVLGNIGIEKEEPKTTGETLLEMLKNSWLYLVLLVVCVVLYYREKTKNEDKTQERIENDKYDDSCID